MGLISKFASINSGTGFTNPTNAYASDNVYATWVSAKSTTVTHVFRVADFTTAEIPNGSTIVYAIAYLESKLSAVVTGGTVSISTVTTTAGGTVITSPNSSENTTAFEVENGTGAFSTAPTLTDLRAASTNISITVSASKGSTNTAMTVSVDAVRLEVLFNPPDDVVPYIGAGYYWCKKLKSFSIPKLWVPGQIATI